MSQQKTQSASKRPYGVGMLVAGCDEKGPHLFESFKTADDATMVQHAVEALHKTMAADQSLTSKNCSVVVITKGQKFKEVPADDLQKCFDKLEKKEPEADAPMPDAAPAA